MSQGIDKTLKVKSGCSRYKYGSNLCVAGNESQVANEGPQEKDKV